MEDEALLPDTCSLQIYFNSLDLGAADKVINSSSSTLILAMLCYVCTRIRWNTVGDIMPSGQSQVLSLVKNWVFQCWFKYGPSLVGTSVLIKVTHFLF